MWLRALSAGADVSPGARAVRALSSFAPVWFDAMLSREQPAPPTDDLAVFTAASTVKSNGYVVCR